MSKAQCSVPCTRLATKLLALCYLNLVKGDAADAAKADSTDGILTEAGLKHWL